MHNQVSQLVIDFYFQFSIEEPGDTFFLARLCISIYTFVKKKNKSHLGINKNNWLLS